MVKNFVESKKDYQFLTYSENGPLTCSQTAAHWQCREMLGFALTQGLIKPNKHFIDSKLEDQFYVMVRNEKTKEIKFIKAGSDKEEAVKQMKKLTKKSSTIGVVLDSNAQMVEKTLTNSHSKGNMKYEHIYSMIGQYQVKDLGLFTAAPKTEVEAGLI